jgi:hypothetical protein
METENIIKIRLNGNVRLHLSREEVIPAYLP